eukprot:1187791-Prorocentrum_minimum.AAC.1
MIHLHDDSDEGHTRVTNTHPQSYDSDLRLHRALGVTLACWLVGREVLEPTETLLLVTWAQLPAWIASRALLVTWAQLPAWIASRALRCIVYSGHI